MTEAFRGERANRGGLPKRRRRREKSADKNMP